MPQIDAYDYCDKLGTLRYQVVRYVPKDFRQRMPDGNGGWIWNMNGLVVSYTGSVSDASTIPRVKPHKTEPVTNWGAA